ncbi:MAG: DUF2726 domain-containing protein [Burkholderiales bacterium]|jgi:hypothetical protein|nr:DUF2726 domain-containing protein [Burkholderiales bacterium]
MAFDPIAVLSLCCALLLTLLLWRRRLANPQRRPQRLDELDTVQDWQPEAARVLTVAERRAYDLLRQALPGLLVLGQVPLSRFLRVPTRHSHAEWMQRVGSLSADLLVCNAGSRVLAVIDIRPAEQTERSRRRHERMARVLKAAGIEVQVWQEDRLPSPAEVRTVLGSVLERGAVPASQSKPVSSRPMPLIPVAEIEELLVHGDAAAQDTSFEPVASAFFDELEPAPTAARAAA